MVTASGAGVCVCAGPRLECGTMEGEEQRMVSEVTCHGLLLSLRF